MQDLLLQFKNKLLTLGQVSENSWDAFKEILQLKTFDKNEHLVRCGNVEHKIHFIASGVVKVFVPHKDREMCTNFRFENQFASSFTSFIQQSPSAYSIRALVETQTLQINHDNLYRLYKEHSDTNLLGRVMMESLLIEKRQRELDLLLLSAEERYHKLVNEYPQYIQQIPLKNLASYLGIAQASLSRIRAKSIK